MVAEAPPREEEQEQDYALGPTGSKGPVPSDGTLWDLHACAGFSVGEFGERLKRVITLHPRLLGSMAGKLLHTTDMVGNERVKDLLPLPIPDSDSTAYARKLEEIRGERS